MIAARLPYRVPLPGGRVLDLGARSLVMGILNVTPDSFAGSAGRLDRSAAVDRALRMVEQGADLVDIGGESTRPGSEPVAAGEELARVLPVVRELAGRLGVPISVDTYKSEVARAVLDNGASIINDISGLQYDPLLGGVVARSGAALIVMHMRGRPKTMYARAHYDHVVEDVSRELAASLQSATRSGVAIESVIVDPGVGFAKRATDSYGVLARLGEVASALDRPVLVGPSRKSFLSEALGGRPAEARDWGTAAAVAAAVFAGAHIVRVHAVEEMTQVVRVAEEIRRQGARAEM